MHEATVRKPRHSRRDVELFVYLLLGTIDRVPLLADEGVAQAARTALAADARMQRCRVLAVGSDRDHLHLVIQFPDSLPPNLLAKTVSEASAEAIARLLAAERQDRLPPDRVWSGPYQMETLSPESVPSAIHYVCHHVGRAAAGQLAWHDFLREETAAYGDDPRP